MQAKTRGGKRTRGGKGRGEGEEDEQEEQEDQEEQEEGEDEEKEETEEKEQQALEQEQKKDATASGYVLSAADQEMLLALRRCVSCHQCMNVVYNAFTFTDCLHTFCEGCVLDIGRHAVCPCGSVPWSPHPYQNIVADTILQGVVDSIARTVGWAEEQEEAQLRHAELQRIRLQSLPEHKRKEHEQTVAALQQVSGQGHGTKRTRTEDTLEHNGNSGDSSSSSSSGSGHGAHANSNGSVDVADSGRDVGVADGGCSANQNGTSADGGARLKRARSSQGHQDENGAAPVAPLLRSLSAPGLLEGATGKMFAASIAAATAAAAQDAAQHAAPEGALAVFIALRSDMDVEAKNRLPQVQPVVVRATTHTSVKQLHDHLCRHVEIPPAKRMLLRLQRGGRPLSEHTLVHDVLRKAGVFVPPLGSIDPGKDETDADAHITRLRRARIPAFLRTASDGDTMQQTGYGALDDEQEDSGLQPPDEPEEVYFNRLFGPPPPPPSRAASPLTSSTRGGRGGRGRGRSRSTRHPQKDADVAAQGVDVSFAWHGQDEHHTRARLASEYPNAPIRSTEVHALHPVTEICGQSLELFYYAGR